MSFVLIKRDFDGLLDPVGLGDLSSAPHWRYSLKFPDWNRLL
jgi:hypothetical protein